MTPEELRQGLIGSMERYLIDLQMTELLDCFAPPYKGGDEDGIDKAMSSAYRQMNNALKQISRIASRLGYVDKIPEKRRINE